MNYFLKELLFVWTLNLPLSYTRKNTDKNLGKIEIFILYLNKIRVEMSREHINDKFHQNINSSLELIDNFLFEIELDDHDNFFRFNVRRIRKNLIKLRTFLISNESKKYLSRINRRLNILIEEVEILGSEYLLNLLIEVQNLLFEIEKL